MLHLVIAIVGCTCSPDGPQADPGLTVDEVAAYVRKGVGDASGWAADLRGALDASDLPIDEAHVCQVLAIVEQESGYEEDPAVPNLGRIARDQIADELSLLGPLADHGVDWLLSPEGVDGRTFDAQLAEVRTEQELDRLFRQIAAHHARHASALPFADGILANRLEALNPVRTAGSMQVAVAWAQDAARHEGIPEETVRDLLYTRAGGLKWGAARLFAHEAGYERPLYRFADFNAGVYASRNAEFQKQLSNVMQLDLTPDGDLLVYDDAGRSTEGQTMGVLLAWRAMYAPDLSERQIRRDVKREKERRFEETETWSRLRSHYEDRTRQVANYARVPDLALDSPKMSKERTTAWFAESVERRFRECLKRVP